MKQTSDILFEYLKNILYYPADAHLDLATLPEEFRKLGEGLQFLDSCVQEERAFAHAIAKGDLSVTPPGSDNVFAASSKELHGMLRHLAWQARQVADGDYSQRVDFMGEFSDSFNTMTAQLQERTASLIEEKKKVEQKNQELTRNLTLLQVLTNYTHNLIFVFSEKTGQRIFANQSAEWFLSASPENASALELRLTSQNIKSHSVSENWELHLDTAKGTAFYSVESFRFTWNGELAIVHIVIDDTARKRRENQFYSLAYIDPLTGLHNRRYGMELMEQWVNSGTPFLISFVDVDNLKYCNDNCGHDAGDCYLTEVASLLKSLSCDVCRVGGDEFFLLRTGSDSDALNLQLSELRDVLIKSEDTPYPKSFSFATSAVPAHPEDPLETYIRRADEKMYYYKQTHKEKLS